MNKRKSIDTFIILLFLMLLWSAGRVSSVSDDKMKEFPQSRNLEVPDTEQTQENKKRVYRERRFGTSKEDMVENIVGYTLFTNRTVTNLWYQRDPDYLLPENMVGNGIYVSEHMSGTEVFLGQILKGLIAECGDAGGNRKYFSDGALQQIAEIDWALLGTDWGVEPYAYGREYTIDGRPYRECYIFEYFFFENENSIKGNKSEQLRIKLLSDEEGIICGIKADVITENTKAFGIEDFVNISTGLCDDRYQKIIIQEGETKEKILLDFSGYYQRWDETYEPNEFCEAGVAAENIAEIVVDILESRGRHASRYQDWFYYESDFERFCNLSWKQLGETWKASEKYDCVYIDQIKNFGYVKFRYYFYSDDAAIIFDCLVSDKQDGVVISYTDMLVTDLTPREDIGAAREKRIEVIHDGRRLDCNIDVCVPVPQTEVPNVLLQEFVFDQTEPAGIEYVKKEIWGYSDVTDLAEYLGEKLWEDLAREEVRNGKDAGETSKLFIDENDAYMPWLDIVLFFERADGVWDVSEGYDCFLITSNAQTDCVSLQYYFYIQKAEERTWVLVVDVNVSADGIQRIKFAPLKVAI